MKIGMMSAWNQDAGPAIHAELIGRRCIGSCNKVASLLEFG